MVEPVANVRPPVATTLVLVVLVAAAEPITMYTEGVAVATPAVVGSLPRRPHARGRRRAPDARGAAPVALELALLLA